MIFFSISKFNSTNKSLRSDDSGIYSCRKKWSLPLTLRAFGPKARKHTELMALLKERPGTYFRQEQSEEGFVFDNLG